MASDRTRELAKDPICTCLHPRSAHGDEMPYECCDMLANGELCDCRGFEYPRITALAAQPTPEVKK